ncbi:hypothetical protein KHQ06_08105 [Nocardia tengchongensis]|uniref:Uncharacterized protein n=1 Tax=Nocardia tengchongensis TaxID=2055889 RepID=A0ABX8CXL3_9NOCA|nr:hypothetical protein [Nocardia tengchongensis]QVI22915.1 hypothetical protein KHQ06_08105 [Nocardia tengchongensis]
MNHKKKDRWTGLELPHRTEIIGGLRDYGHGYSDIARTLGISLNKVEKCLGEAAALRAKGFTKAEVAELLNVPYGSIGRMLPAAHSTTITTRQSQVLDVTAEMRGMQVDLIAAYLDVELSTAYDIIRPLIANGLLYPLARVGQGTAWVVPRKEAAAPRLGWRPKDWSPSMMWANHDRAVAQARIMLVGSDPHRWISERQLRPAPRRSPPPHARRRTSVRAGSRTAADRTFMTAGCCGRSKANCSGGLWKSS